MFRRPVWAILMPHNDRLEGPTMTEVFVLGAGTRIPTGNRIGSAHVLRIGDEALMFD